jgi:hypothetical protein
LTLRRVALSIVPMVSWSPGKGWGWAAALVMVGPLAAGQTRDEIVARAVQAQGGLARLRATTTRITTGKISFDGHGANPFTVEQKRPDRLLMEIFFPAGVLRRGYDGEVGWQANPFAERKEAEPMSSAETRSIAEEAAFDDALVDWQARGSRVELVGKEPVEGRPAFRVRVTLKNGLAQDVFLDAQTYLKVRWEGARPMDGKTMLFESSFTDYRVVDGLKLPFRIDARARGGDNRQEIVITRVELNAPIDEARFSLPKSADKTAAPATSPKP